MLNCFNLYAIIWSVVLFLYDLGWSDYCSPLNVWLRIFIYASIVVSIILGQIFKPRMRYKKCIEQLNINNTGTIIICSLQIFEYIYCKKIPLIDTIFYGGDYTDFGGIPTLHLILYTFATFYSQYLFYGYLNEKKKRYLLNYIIILLVVFGLQFMRGGLTVCLSISAVMLLSSIQSKIRPKHIVISIVVVLIAVYLFGGFGNVRQGTSWNDSSAFLRFGRINSKFPTWLPKQFAWAYSYIVGSLGTLNYNVLRHNTASNFGLFIQSIIPDFIQRRLWPQTELASGILLWRGFTTTTGYFSAYYYGGIVGLYVMYSILVIIAVYVTKSNRVKEKYRVIIIANMGIIIGLFFFTNTISKSAIGFSIVYPIVFSLIRKKFIFTYGGIKIGKNQGIRLVKNLRGR